MTFYDCKSASVGARWTWQASRSEQALKPSRDPGHWPTDDNWCQVARPGAGNNALTILPASLVPGETGSNKVPENELPQTYR